LWGGLVPGVSGLVGVDEAGAGVENNLSISNLDWEDFADAVDSDGVFRGFEDRPPTSDSED
jgi:hypothetical protein